MNFNTFNQILKNSHIEFFENQNFKSFECEVVNDELTIVTICFDEPYYEMRTYFVRNGLVDEEEIEFEN